MDPLSTSPTAPATSTMKGTALRGYRSYVEKRLEPAVRTALLAALRPDVRALLAGDGLLVSSMYPIELQHHLLEVVARVTGAASESHLRNMGREVAETDLRGIYRVFIWAASVPQTLAVLTKVWNSYFSTGVARWTPEDRQRGTIHITDRFQHPLHHPVVAGYVEVAVRLAGGKDGRVVYGPSKDHTVPFICTWRT